MDGRVDVKLGLLHREHAVAGCHCTDGDGKNLRHTHAHLAWLEFQAVCFRDELQARPFAESFDLRGDDSLFDAIPVILIVRRGPDHVDHDTQAGLDGHLEVSVLLDFQSQSQRTDCFGIEPGVVCLRTADEIPGSRSVGPAVFTGRTQGLEVPLRNPADGADVADRLQLIQDRFAHTCHGPVEQVESPFCCVRII